MSLGETETVPVFECLKKLIYGFFVGCDRVPPLIDVPVICVLPLSDPPLQFLPRHLCVRNRNGLKRGSVVGDGNGRRLYLVDDP